MKHTIITEIQSSISAEELQRISGLPLEVFSELVELGALDPFREEDAYTINSVVVIKKAARLRSSFQLDTSALALLIHFITETEELRHEIRKIQRTNPLFE